MTTTGLSVCVTLCSCASSQCWTRGYGTEEVLETFSGDPPKRFGKLPNKQHIQQMAIALHRPVLKSLPKVGFLCILPETGQRRSLCLQPEWFTTFCSSSWWSSSYSTSSLVSSSTPSLTWEARSRGRRRSWKPPVSSAVRTAEWPLNGIFKRGCIKQMMMSCRVGKGQIWQQDGVVWGALQIRTQHVALPLLPGSGEGERPDWVHGTRELRGPDDCSE